MSPLLDALRDATGGPEVPEIHDIVPPMEVPIPLWVKLLIAAGLLVILGFAVWGVIVLAKRRPKTPPLTPRDIALRDLEQLRAQVQTLDPHAFSVAVSDVLRQYVDAQYGLRAGKQTSPEFLASIQAATAFSDDDRRLLADFLERCDLLKFARIEADSTTSEGLLSSALAFVQGGRA